MNDSSESLAFAWDIYAFGAGSDLSAQNINLSGLDETNDFSSPDGLRFGRASNVTGQGTPLMWIETDDGAYTDVTNCMLLASIPALPATGRPGRSPHLELAAEPGVGDRRRPAALRDDRDHPHRRRHYRVVGQPEGRRCGGAPPLSSGNSRSPKAKLTLSHHG